MIGHHRPLEMGQGRIWRDPSAPGAANTGRAAPGLQATEDQV